MPEIKVNGVDLFYVTRGEGEPLFLVHGSWVDHGSWRGVVPALAESFRVVAYDRRGHSRSEASAGQGSRRQDEDDLAALIEGLECAPAHVAGNSFGASTTLGLASRRPELFRSLIVHEPPLMGVVADYPELAPLMAETDARIQAVLALIEQGDFPNAAERFVEDVALGPGMWQQLPAELRDVFIQNAPTWLDEQRDPEWASLDLDAIAPFPAPALLTKGDQSPPWFEKIIARLAEALPRASVITYAGAGHIPQTTHPDDYAATVTDFLRS